MKKLYDIVLKAINEVNLEKHKHYCGNCLSMKIQKELDKECINYNYYNGSACSNVLFYLEDLGIIKILSGIANRNSGVDCHNLKIKVLHPFEGNKI